MALQVSEIYLSIQGEGTRAGLPCVFVRLVGCNLRCRWCDSAFSFQGGERRELGDVLDEVAAFGVPLVLVTGGEPLLQADALPLMAGLRDRGHEVLLETSGSLPITAVPEGVAVVLDLKPPGSGELAANLWSNLDQLDADDEIKLVLASRDDYLWARTQLRQRGLAARCTVLFSPVFGAITAAELVAWVLEDRLDVRVQLQLHKLIWPAEARGV